MNYELGKYVVIPGHGVGQILSMEERVQNNQTILFFQLKLVSTGAKIMFPVLGKDSVRELVSEEEIQEVYRHLEDHENVQFNRSTWNRRYRDYMVKINSGSLKEIADVMREILLLRAEKKLSYSEKRVLDHCRELLTSEIAISSGNEENAVSNDIDAIFN